MKSFLCLLLGALNFVLLKHPFFLSVNLLLMSGLSLYLFVDVLLNHWFSFIFYLVYLGGVLILFVYISGMVPNSWSMIFPSAIGYILLMLGLFVFVDFLMDGWSVKSSFSMVYSIGFFKVFMIILVILMMILIFISYMIRFFKQPLRVFS